MCVRLLADMRCACARCCVGAQWHMCAGRGGGVELVVGHGLGAWCQRWAGRRRWELPVGSLL